MRLTLASRSAPSQNHGINLNFIGKREDIGVGMDEALILLRLHLAGDVRLMYGVGVISQLAVVFVATKRSMSQHVQ